MSTSASVRMRNTCASGLVLWVLALSSVARAEGDEEATVPADPFAGSYELPRERELGATAGQFRAIGSVLLAAGGKALERGVHGTLELMTFPYLSVRGSLQLAFASEEPTPVFMAKTGPSLHVLPYRRVDLSLFFEGGVAVMNTTKRDHAPMVVAAPGATFEVWLSHWAFLRVEGHGDCGFYAQAGQAMKYFRYSTLLGVGLAI
jgi:hypothetical protein